MLIDKHTLIRYFLHQSPDDEKEAIHQWLESDEANKKLFIQERIRFDISILADEKRITAKKRFHIHPFAAKGLKIAALLLFLLSSIYLFDSYRMDKLNNTFQYVRVPAGNRTNIILPDGSEVWLNANTTLQYPIAFVKADREVILDGEAYFEVAKSKKPFIVKTNKYNIEVLGTTFNVEAYSKESNFKTALFTGKIKLYNDTTVANATYLTPGQTAQLVDNTLHISPTTDVNIYRWREGLIYIENKSFDEIMRIFEKYYSIRIITENKHVKGLGYYGKLRIADGIDHALRVLQNDFPFTYKRDIDTDTIYIY